jgi:Tfp pilus assembly protein PilZ
MRRFGRRPAELPVTVRAAGNKVEAGILLDSGNLSEGGAFLRSALLFEIGEVLHLEIPLPSGDVVKTTGRVVRVSRSRGKEVEAGMGIEFTTLSSQDKKTLATNLPNVGSNSGSKSGTNSGTGTSSGTKSGNASNSGNGVVSKPGTKATAKKT